MGLTAADTSRPVRVRPPLRTSAWLLFAALALTSAPTNAVAATFHVATTGSDSTGDGSLGNPWATITEALDSVPDESLILVGAGTYTGRVRLRGRFPIGVTVRSEPVYRAMLRASSSSVLTCYDCEGITIEGFDIAHSGPGAAGLVMQVQDENPGDGLPSGRMVLENNIFHDSYNNDILKINNAATDVTVRGNMFYNQAGSDEHMDVNSVTNVVIEDNVFFNDFAGSGRTDDDTSSFIVVKDSNGASDGIVGSSDVTIRRNVFLHWEGSSGHGFVRLGEDGTATFEARDVLVENNLMLGNNSAEIRSPIQFQGVRDSVARANTISGDMPAKEFGFRIVTVGSNPDAENITVANNIWTDPTGTMGTTFNRGSATTNLLFDNNLYWNAGNAFPTSGESIVEVADDANGVVGDPLLADPAAATLPRWLPGAGQFADGSATIREVFERLVSLYGVPAAGSAALDAADPSEMPSDDILGNDRSLGGAPDIGAFETPSCAGVADGTPCDDGNDCTTTDECATEVCVGTNDDGAACDDGNGCTAPDLCAAGVCIGAPDDGAACDDGNPCTSDDSCASGECAVTVGPNDTCRLAEKGSLRLRASDTAGKDLMQWSWQGVGTVAADFGDPVAGATDYALCIYDGDGTGYANVYSALLSAGATCDGRECWKAQGTKGFRYKSKSGQTEGVRQLKLKSAGKASIKLKAGRSPLTLPALPLGQDPDVVVQLAASNGICWETSLTPPAKRNDTSDFRDGN